MHLVTLLKRKEEKTRSRLGEPAGIPAVQFKDVSCFFGNFTFEGTKTRVTRGRKKTRGGPINVLAQINVLAHGKRTRSNLTCSLNPSFLYFFFRGNGGEKKKRKQTEMATSHEKATCKNGVVYTYNGVTVPSPGYVLSQGFSGEKKKLFKLFSEWKLRRKRNLREHSATRKRRV